LAFKGSKIHGRDLGQHRVDAQVDGCSMIWRILAHLREKGVNASYYSEAKDSMSAQEGSS
jgi:hypothetical protein